MYPTNIKIKKISKTKILKEKLWSIKDSIKKQIEYLLYDRKHFAKIIMVKLHI